MLTSEAVRVYKTKTAIAEVLDISLSAVCQWEEYVPPLSAMRLAKHSKGKLKFDSDFYESWNKASQPIAS
jgi:hypothetical protein